MAKRKTGKCAECGQVKALLSADRCYSCVLSAPKKAEPSRSKPKRAEQSRSKPKRAEKAGVAQPPSAVKRRRRAGQSAQQPVGRYGNVLEEAAVLMDTLAERMERLRDQHRALRLAYIKLRDMLRETEAEMVAAATAEPDGGE